MKKFKVVLSVFLLISFAAYFLDVSVALHGKAYSSRAFASYKVVVTAGKLNIRKSPSTRASIVGSYSRGNIVDVIGQSGSFLKTSRGYIAASYTRRYTSQPSTPSRGGRFTPYKVQVTTSKLNIRKSPSTKASLVGYYTKGAIVDVIGQSGSFLRTSRGYIAAAYTKKYSPPSNNTGGSGNKAPSFKTYKVDITTSKLNIRKSATTSSPIVGYYTRGQIVDIIGKSGSFLRTSKGYIAEAYTRVHTSSNGNTETPEINVGTGKYIVMNESTPLLIDINGASDERYAVKGKEYEIVSQSGNYYKIKIGRKYGYVPVSKTVLLDKPYTDKITLVWDYLYSRSSNPSHYDESTDYLRRQTTSTGIDIMSPTWFYLQGDYSKPSSITVGEKADREYSRVAHQNGYEVWALLQEFNADRANKIFTDNTVRQRVINQIVEYAAKYDVDGVNIDFEGIGKYSSNKDGFTAFTRDLSAALKKAGFSASVDVVKPTVGSVYSSFTDRPVLAKYVDYIVYMAYDEHYAGSKTAGSVGSFPWVEKGLKDMISQGVPKEKIILGVPFYLRDFTLVETQVPYNSVAFEKAGALYKTPNMTDTNRIADIKPGYALKLIENNQDWCKVEYDGAEAYIPSKNVAVIPANTNPKSIEASVDMVLSYDSIALKYDSNIYSQMFESDSYKVMSGKVGHAFKYISTIGDWYKVEYNGTEAYIPQRNSVYVNGDGKDVEGETIPQIMLPFDSVMVKSQTIVRKSPVDANENIITTTSEGDSFEYVSIAPENSNWYIVKCNGVNAYTPKDGTFFISSSTKQSSVVKSSSISVRSAAEKKQQYNGRVYYDDYTRQNVLEYYTGGYKHLVWLEDSHSMGWRMDIIRNYGLAGMGAWDLNWNPTDDIWNVIKQKLK